MEELISRQQEEFSMNCVTLEVFDQIATVTINRPKALNALNTQTLTELRE